MVERLKRGNHMMYKVTLEVYKYIEADNVKKAKQEFRQNFEWADVDYGTYQVEPYTRKEVK
jgi:hypothetical protein